MDKSKLHRTVLQQLQDSLQGLQQHMKQLTEDAANDSKSSVGDKHETSRAQMHLEQEKLSQAISNIEQQLHVMERLSVEISDSIRAGSVVETSIGWFYIAVPNLILDFEGNKFRCISSVSPLGKLLLHKVKSDRITINKDELVVYRIF